MFLKRFRRKPRVAICLSGFLRSYRDTYESFMECMQAPYDCDLFIYAPDVTGAVGNLGDPRSKVWTWEDYESRVNPDSVRAAYGPTLRRMTLWTYDAERFRRQTRELAELDPPGWTDRIFSMYHHVQQANRLKSEYEADQGFRYDFVIRCRPDLMFYKELDLGRVDPRVITMPLGEGFDSKGRANRGAAPVLRYENAERGERMEAGAMCMNDQVGVSSSINMDAYSSVADHVAEYARRGVPLHPESLLAYHLHFEHRLKLEMQAFTVYEILRSKREKPPTEAELQSAAALERERDEWFQANRSLFPGQDVPPEWNEYIAIQQRQSGQGEGGSSVAPAEEKPAD
jgi:hypothetical protein